MALKLSIFLSIAFFVLTSIAMIAYTGGSLFHPAEAHYFFIGNFYSDLGRYRDFAGNVNGIPMALFAASLVAASVGQFIHHKVLHEWLIHSCPPRLSVVSKISYMFSGSASMGLLCVAATPWDVLFILHTIAVDITFISLFVANFGFGVVLFLDQSLSSGMRYIKASVAVVIVAYLFLLRIGPNPFTDERSANIQSLGQKCVVASIILAVCLGSIIMLRANRVRCQALPDISLGRVKNA